MEQALAVSPSLSHSCEMLCDYGLLSETVREEAPVLWGNDFSEALVWMGGGRAAKKQSGVGAGCSNSHNFSPSVRANAMNDAWPTQESRRGTYENTSTQKTRVTVCKRFIRNTLLALRQASVCPQAYAIRDALVTNNSDILWHSKHDWFTLRKQWHCKAGWVQLLRFLLARVEWLSQLQPVILLCLWTSHSNWRARYCILAVPNKVDSRISIHHMKGGK